MNYMAGLKASIINSIDRAHRSINNKIKDRWPLVSLYFYTKPRAKWLYYRNERALMRGEDVSNSDHQSIVFFSVHKAATMYVNGILSDLVLAHGLIPIDYSGWFSTDSERLYDNYENPDFMKKVFREKGYYYGAFRVYRKIPDLDRFKTIIVLRDPRDVLVSHYYSVAFSHAVINNKLREERQKALNQTIDEYVLELAPDMLTRYQDHAENVIGKPGVLFLTYEEMTEDFENWLNKIVKHTGLNKHPEIQDRIIANSKFTKGSGEKKDHVRSARPGDHKDKLKPETIEELDKMFAPIMIKMGYPIT